MLSRVAAAMCERTQFGSRQRVEVLVVGGSWQCELTKTFKREAKPSEKPTQTKRIFALMVARRVFGNGIWTYE